MRGLVWAPNLHTGRDPVSGLQCTFDGTTHNVTGRYRAFNGTTDRVDWPNVRDFGTVPAAHSGCCWLYPTSVAAGLPNIWTAANIGPAQSIIFRRTAAALQFAHAYSTTGVLRQSAADVLTVNTWQFVWWSYDGSGLGAGVTLGVGPAEVGSYATTTNSSGTPRAADGVWSLGGRVEADTNNIAGRIREPLVWDRVLSVAEFATLARMPRPA